MTHHRQRNAMAPATVLLAACAAVLFTGMPTRAASLTSAGFGTTADGKPVTRYTVTSGSGVVLSFIDYGGAMDRQRPLHA